MTQPPTGQTTGQTTGSGSGDLQALRATPFFDAEWYAEKYPDVSLMGMEPAEHYLTIGAELGRSPSPRFDLVGYLEQVPELRTSGENPLLHWLRHHDSDPDDGATPVPAVGRTHLGPVFDGIVEHARNRTRARGSDPDYDRLHDHFDFAHYLLANATLLDARKIDLVDHFLRTGVQAKRTPDVNFSMRTYLQRHPERAEGDRNPYLAWLEEGRDAGEIADPAPGLDKMAEVIGVPTRDLVGDLAATRSDLTERLRTGRLGEMFAKAAEIEPLVARSWPEMARPKILPFATPHGVNMAWSIRTCHEALDFRRARMVLVINRPRWGGGRRIEGHLAHALARQVPADQVVVIYTDADGSTPRDRFPAGVREVDLFGIAERGGLSQDDRQRVLVELVRSLRADAVVNINSALLYGALEPFGQALRATERIFLCFFCNDQGRLGEWGGYPIRTFYRYFEMTEGVITDSHHLRDWLVDTYQLGDQDAERLHVLSAPVETSIPVATAPRPQPERRPQVFWAGRLDRQKRIDLLLEVARRLPDVDVRMWGEAALGGGAELALPDNVVLEGKYDHLADLDLSQADLWLYTSGWDGVPSQLLEVAMTGIPMVGSLVGGTGEVLHDDLSWPVAEADDPEAYVAGVREVLADPEEARRKAAALRERLAQQRTEKGYGERAASILLLEEAR